MDPGSGAEARQRSGAVALGALAVAAAALLAPAGAAVAATSVAGLVGELDSDSLEVRERSAHQIASMLDAASVTGSGPIVGMIEDSLIGELRGDRLSLEQRSRVLEIMRARFMRSPRGAIGVSFDNTALGAAPGMAIQNLVNGFPAHERGLLRVGDVIVEVRGITVGAPGSGFRLVQPLVASHEPGDVVPMTIIRPDQAPGAPGAAGAPAGAGDGGMAPRLLITEGEQKNATRIDVLVPLGSYADLGGGGMLGRAMLEAAWRARVARLGVGSGASRTAALDLTSSDWNRRSGQLDKPVDDMRLAGTNLPGAREDQTRAAAISSAEFELQQQLLRGGVRIGAELLPGRNQNAAQAAALREKLMIIEGRNRDLDETQRLLEQLRSLNQQVEALKLVQKEAKTVEERASLDSRIEVLSARIARLLQSLKRPAEQPARP